MPTAQEKAAQDAAKAAEAAQAAKLAGEQTPNGLPEGAAGTDEAASSPDVDASAGTYILVGTYTETTSKPGQPFTYKAYGPGDKVKLSADRAAELIAAGAVLDPSAGKDTVAPGGETKAPK